MSHLLWTQPSRSAYSSTGTKCPTCCEHNPAEVLTAVQVQMSHLLWIQPGHGRNTAHRWESTYTVLVDLLLGFSLGFSSSGMGGISSSTLPFSSMPISASVRLASQLWVFFSVSSFSWSGRENTGKHSLYSNMLSVHTVCVYEREIVCDCVWLWVCVTECACVHVCAWMLHREIMHVWICVAMCIVCYLYLKHFQPQNQLFKNCPLLYYGKMPIIVIVTLSLWAFNGNEMQWAKTHLISSLACNRLLKC